jgi:hypothetical protein
VQQTGESVEANAALPPRQTRLSPVTVFLGLIAVLIATGAIVLLTRDNPPEPPPATTRTTSNFALTNTEAIARFKELHAIQLWAYRSHDVSLLSMVFSSDSVIGDTVSNEIRDLNRDDVSARPHYETQSLEVIENGTSAIRLQQTAVFRARFVDKHGKDITVGRKPELQVIEWTLHPQQGSWLIFDSRILQAEPIAKNS